MTETSPDEVRKDVPCAYCDANVVAKCFVICSECEVPLHRECWDSTGRCPAFGCGSSVIVDPAVKLYRSKASALMVSTAAGPLVASRAELTDVESRLKDINRTAIRDVAVVLSGVAAIVGTGFLGSLWLCGAATLCTIGAAAVTVWHAVRDQDRARILQRRLDRLTDELPLDRVDPSIKRS